MSIGSMWIPLESRSIGGFARNDHDAPEDDELSVFWRGPTPEISC